MKLNELVSLVRGKTYKSSLLSEQVGPVLLGLGSIEQNGGFKRGVKKHYPGESDSRILLYPGDLYVSLKDLTQACNLLGAVARVPHDIQEGRLTQDTVKLEFGPNTNNSTRLYTYWSLRTPQYRAYCKSHGTGTTNMSLSRSDFLAWEVPHPTKWRDTLIALFESIEDKIYINNRINDYLAELCCTMYTSFIHSENSSNWQNSNLSELVEVKYGKDHKKLEDGPYPVYGSGGYMRSAERSLYEGESVLIPRKGTLNNVMYVDEAFWTVDTMFFTVPLKPGAAKYVYQYLKTLDLASMNAGSAVPSMTTEILNGLPLPIPDEVDLISFDTQLKAAYDLIRRNNAENTRLEELRDALLPKLMSGEIDVSQVDLMQLNNHLPTRIALSPSSETGCHCL